MRRIAAATILIAVAFAMVALAVHAQSPTIAGRVVADDTGSAVRSARVAISTASQPSTVVLTDSDGRFAFAPPGGRYSIAASKSGYARREVTPAPGQTIELRLPRGAVIVGRVVDEFGDPVPFVRVAAQTPSKSSADPATVATADTDDRGEYRLASLPAGAYIVSVVTVGAAIQRSVGDRAVAFVPAQQRTYYPGVATPREAHELRLQAGEELPIDFVVSADQTTALTGMMMSAVSGPSSSPQASTGTVTVRGQVVSTDGRAIPRARVMVLPATDFRESQFVRTDSDGRYEFRNMSAGTFRIVAEKSGYSPVASDEAPPAGSSFLPSGVAVELMSGETRERVTLRLARWGTLAGRVLDEYGDPLQGASVQVLQVRYEAGRRRLIPAGAAARLTDDLGRYRLFAIAPGRYVVSAAVGDVSSADLPGYARTYFPGTANASEAQFVSIGASQDLAAIDFSLSRTRTARVAGKLLNAAGQSTAGGSLHLVPSHRSNAAASVAVGGRINADGTFEFTNVPAGQYVIQANRGRSNSWTEGEFGAMPVAVNGADVTALILQTSSGSSIAGRFRFESYNDSKPPAPAELELSARPVDFDASPPGVASARVESDGTFQMRGINGPRRLQLLRVPAGWALREIVVRGVDATDRALSFGRKDQSLTDVEVVLTDRVSLLRGKVTDDRARATPGASVIVFSADRDRWYPASRFLRKAITGTDGTYLMTGLAFGAYYAVAVPQLPAEGEDAWQDPQYLESLIPRASTVTVSDGQKLSIDLRVASR